MPYTICIDETQREIIATALLAFDGAKHFNPDDFNDLLQLFCDLPKVSTENPNIIHGFCY